MPYSICQLKVRNFKCFNSSRFYEFNFIKDSNPIFQDQMDLEKPLFLTPWN